MTEPTLKDAVSAQISKEFQKNPSPALASFLKSIYPTVFGIYARQTTIKQLISPARELKDESRSWELFCLQSIRKHYDTLQMDEARIRMYESAIGDQICFAINEGPIQESRTIVFYTYPFPNAPSDKLHLTLNKETAFNVYSDGKLTIDHVDTTLDMNDRNFMIEFRKITEPNRDYIQELSLKSNLLTARIVRRNGPVQRIILPVVLPYPILPTLS